MVKHDKLFRRQLSILLELRSNDCNDVMYLAFEVMSVSA